VRPHPPNRLPPLAADGRSSLSFSSLLFVPAAVSAGAGFPALSLARPSSSRTIRCGAQEHLPTFRSSCCAPLFYFAVVDHGHALSEPLSLEQEPPTRPASHTPPRDSEPWRTPALLAHETSPRSTGRFPLDHTVLSTIYGDSPHGGPGWRVSRSPSPVLVILARRAPLSAHHHARPFRSTIAASSCSAFVLLWPTSRSRAPDHGAANPPRRSPLPASHEGLWPLWDPVSRSPTSCCLFVVLLVA